jgi:hypothetical protein
MLLLLLIVLWYRLYLIFVFGVLLLILHIVEIVLFLHFEILRALGFILSLLHFESGFFERLGRSGVSRDGMFLGRSGR